MANWLQNLGKPEAKLPAKAQSTALTPTQTGQVPALPKTSVAANGLPTASVIYGIAASVLLVISIYFLFTGLWFTGFLTLLPAICFLGFALHILKLQG